MPEGACIEGIVARALDGVPDDGVVLRAHGRVGLESFVGSQQTSVVFIRRHGFTAAAILMILTATGNVSRFFASNYV